MTLDEMKLLYTKVMGRDARMDLTTSKSFTVRLWDGMDGVWCDLPEATNVDLAFAMRTWCERTNDGTQNTKYGDIDYYKIFSAETKLMYSGGHTMFRDDESDDE